MRDEHRIGLRLPVAALLIVPAFVLGCDDGAPEERRAIREHHAPAVAQVLREDIERHRAGVRAAADRLAPGFAVEDLEARQRQMRYALRYVQEPPRGIPEFIASPMSFLAAIGPDGVVLLRDGEEEDDRLRGQNFGERYPVVARALEGQSGMELGEFDAPEGAESSWSMLFAHPVRHEGRLVGAVVAGIPLWRWAQRLGRQLQVEHADQDGLILWVYMYKADRIFHFGTPEGLDAKVPSASERQEGLGRSPGGYTGQVQDKGRWFGYGVLPTPSVAEDVGVIIFRSDPV